MKSIGIYTGEKRLSLTPNMEKWSKDTKGKFIFKRQIQFSMKDWKIIPSLEIKFILYSNAVPLFHWLILLSVFCVDIPL